ncbi:MAG: tetratricopeptide repeat protein [Deltaproteobacteria bacterium]|nr:MAG: tetratricopeptide repeat protein [Deltaproteobacteria bacterium]
MGEDAERPGIEVERRAALGDGGDRGGELGLEREGVGHATHLGGWPRAVNRLLATVGDSWRVPALAGATGIRYGTRMSAKEDLYDRAVDLIADDKLEAAVAAYREAIALDAEYADAWQGLALVYNDLGRHDEAIAAAKRLCELTPEDVLAHTTLSRMYQAAGMVPEAETAGAKARMLDWKRQLREPKPE